MRRALRAAETADSMMSYADISTKRVTAEDGIEYA